jgi:pimeloyl-ACP methyl ester carboxylesterase
VFYVFSVSPVVTQLKVLLLVQWEGGGISFNGNSLIFFTAGRQNDPDGDPDAYITWNTTVILEPGLGLGYETWLENDLLYSLAEDNYVIAYNRVGYSPSTAYGIRDLNNLTADFAAIKYLVSYRRKVILIGHALGGAIVRKFAIEHPEVVQAIILIDPMHEDYLPYKSMTQAQEDEIVTEFRNDGNTGGAAEAEQLIENLDILNELGNLPDVPVVVITSTKHENGVDVEDREQWEKAHASLGEGVSNFNHIIVPNQGHFIYLENLLILNAVKSVL